MEGTFQLLLRGLLCHQNFWNSFFVCVVGNHFCINIFFIESQIAYRNILWFQGIQNIPCVLILYPVSNVKICFTTKSFLHCSVQNSTLDMRPFSVFNFANFANLESFLKLFHWKIWCFVMLCEPHWAAQSQNYFKNKKIKNSYLQKCRPTKHKRYTV